MHAQIDDTSGNANRRFGRFQRGGIGIAIFLKQLRRAGGPVKFVRICVVAACLDLGKLFLALLKLIGWLER
jgi:hypothetical protein